MTPDGPVLRVRRRDPRGGAGFWEEWYCDPPPAGLGYLVLREEWPDGVRGDLPVRRIYEVRPVPPAPAGGLW